MKQVPRWFSEELKRIDPALRAVYYPPWTVRKNDNRGRWRIIRLNSGKQKTPRERLPLYRLQYVTDFNGEPIFRPVEQGVGLLWLEDHRGDYMDPSPIILEMLRAGDGGWSREALSKAVAEESRKREKDEEEKQEYIDDVAGSVASLANPKIDMGARSFR